MTSSSQKYPHECHHPTTRILAKHSGKPAGLTCRGEFGVRPVRLDRTRFGRRRSLNDESFVNAHDPLLIRIPPRVGVVTLPGHHCSPSNPRGFSLNDLPPRRNVCRSVTTPPIRE